jgi:hypothetical protein
MYFPRNWEFGSALSKLRNFRGGRGVWTPPSVRHCLSHHLSYMFKGIVTLLIACTLTILPDLSKSNSSSLSSSQLALLGPNIFMLCSWTHKEEILLYCKCQPYSHSTVKYNYCTVIKYSSLWSKSGWFHTFQRKVVPSFGRLGGSSCLYMLLLPLIITATSTILDAWRCVIKSHLEYKYSCD